MLRERRCVGPLLEVIEERAERRPGARLGRPRWTQVAHPTERASRGVHRVEIGRDAGSRTLDPRLFQRAELAALVFEDDEELVDRLERAGETFRRPPRASDDRREL